jgi:glycosyltransferase involved in cell wall biosynthesis
MSADPRARDEVEFHLAGVLTAADREAVGQSPAVRLLGYTTHAESIQLIRTADLLFLPMQNLPAGVRSTIVPGKTYEYLASGSPILAAVPDGDARDILVEAGNATLCRPDDVDGMAAALADRLERWRAGTAPDRPDPNVVARFEYRHLAGRLAEVFDEVLDEPGTRAAAAARPS